MIDEKKIKSANIRVRLRKEDKQAFTSKCARLAVKTSDEFRVLLDRLLNTEEIASYMQRPRVMPTGMYLNEKNEESSMSIRISPTEQTNFYKLCKEAGYTPSKVARCIIQDWCKN